MRTVVRRTAAAIGVSRFVNALDEITSLLKFNRQEESSRDIDPLHLNALLIAAARSYLIGPICQPARISLTIQKVQVVLLYKKVRLVNRITSVCHTHTASCSVHISSDLIY